MAAHEGNEKSKTRDKASRADVSGSNKLAEASLTHQLDDFKKQKSGADKDAVQDKDAAKERSAATDKDARQDNDTTKGKEAALRQDKKAAEDKDTAVIRNKALAIPPPAELHFEKIHPPIAEQAAWKKLGTAKMLWPCNNNSAQFYQFHMKHSVMNLVVADMHSGAWQLRPAIHNALEPTSKDGIDDKVSCVINGGYFGGHASLNFVKINGTVVSDPSDGLRNNPKLKDRAEAIISRSEVRVLKDKAQHIKLDIARHSDPVPGGVTVKELAQTMQDLGCVKALNLDGGSSTTMYVHTDANASACTVKPGTDVNANKPERPVKSFFELVHETAPRVIPSEAEPGPGK